MDTLPLPPRPDLDQYRKRAKSLVAAANSGDPNAVKHWATDWLKALSKLRGVEITTFAQDSFDRAVEGLGKEVASRRASGAAGVTRHLQAATIFASHATERDFRRCCRPLRLHLRRRRCPAQLGAP